MPVPPLILIWYIAMIGRYIWHRLFECCGRQNRIGKDGYHVTKIFSKFERVMIKYNWCILEMIPLDPQFTEKCTAFEHAATYDYARLVVENKGRRAT